MSNNTSAASPPAPPSPPGGPAPPHKKSGLWLRVRTFPSRVGTLLLSLFFVVCVPIFPIFVECVKDDGTVSSQSFLLTAAVMAAGFAVATDDQLFQTAYGLIFLASVVYDFKTAEIVIYGGPPASGASSQDFGTLIWGLISHNFCIMLASLTAILQVVQRVYWHLILDRKFPDWAKG